MPQTWIIATCPSESPLTLGVHGWQASDGIAAEKSNLQSGVASSMAWATGDFGLFGSNPSSSTVDEPAARRLLVGLAERGWLQRQSSSWLTGRQLVGRTAAKGSASETDGEETDEGQAAYEPLTRVGGNESAGGEAGSGDALLDHTTGSQQLAFNSLLSVLFIFIIVFGIAACVTCTGQLCWRHRFNRRYYAERKLATPKRRRLRSRAKFKALPAVCDHPNPPQ